MRTLIILAISLAAASGAWAADKEAGRSTAAVCSACHGINGVSVAPDIPNLAGQREAYIVSQLKAFRDEARKNPLMNAIAPQLSDSDMENVAAYFSSLPGHTGDDVSDLPEAVNRTHVSFPEGYEDSFTAYTTINFPDRKQVRIYLANATALEAAGKAEPLPNGSSFLVEIYNAKLDADGNPVTGGDGFFEQDKLAAFTAMQMEDGWGAEIPEVLRNGDWNYAVFGADRAMKTGVNQAQCLACHKPLTDVSFIFTLDALAEKAKAMP
jgi:cytochrome c553